MDRGDGYEAGFDRMEIGARAAILFGAGRSGEATAQSWADLLGTINYEIVTSPRGRILRSYIGGSDGGR